MNELELEFGNMSLLGELFFFCEHKGFRGEAAYCTAPTTAFHPHSELQHQHTSCCRKTRTMPTALALQTLLDPKTNTILDPAQTADLLSLLDGEQQAEGGKTAFVLK